MHSETLKFENIHCGLNYAFMTSSLNCNIYQFNRNKSRT